MNPNLQNLFFQVRYERKRKKRERERERERESNDSTFGCRARRSGVAYDRVYGNSGFGLFTNKVKVIAREEDLKKGKPLCF